MSIKHVGLELGLVAETQCPTIKAKLFGNLIKY